VTVSVQQLEVKCTIHTDIREKYAPYCTFVYVQTGASCMCTSTLHATHPVLLPIYNSTEVLIQLIRAIIKSLRTAYKLVFDEHKDVRSLALYSDVIEVFIEP